ncbi:tetratricopeptide repeat protein [Candidatus Thorarchaeota archaeon]|nr:MAG: tetratricopeptide repeat protein [Candidatus Thorarchaeota archaeon]
MKEQTLKIQPYHSSDGEYVTLVEFAIEAARVLDQTYNPKTEWSERVNECVPYEYEISRFSFGEEPQIIRIIHKMGYEPKYGGHAEDDVFIVCEGLPEDMKLELRVLRFYYDPRFIEIHVKGPDKEVENVLQGFDEHFNVEHIPDENEIRRTLQTARAALVVHAWRAAELNAQYILKHEPYNAIATMYLGIARAAQGFEPEGENLLLASLTLNPRNVDAYYNLGLIVLDQGRCIFASDVFKKGLSLDPENHPLHYHLGKTLERLGKLGEALESYQMAVKHSPNPDQIWGYTGKDFTLEARESVSRLQEVIETGKLEDKDECEE